MKVFLPFFMAIVVLSFLTAPKGRVQNEQPIDLNGIWKVSGNQYDEGKEVCIKQTGQSLKARFFLGGEGHCPPAIERAGNYGRGDVFLEGTVHDTKAETNRVDGKIYLCTTVEKLVYDCGLHVSYSSDFDGHAEQDTIKFHARMDYVNYDVNAGKWTNCRIKPGGGTPLSITLTREPCPQDVCSYEITQEEVRRAVLKALQDHNVQLSPRVQNYLECCGILIGTDSKGEHQGNSISILFFLDPVPITVGGHVYHTPCTSADGAGIAVQFVVCRATLENGKIKDPCNAPLQNITNKGSFDQKGLDQAMKADFDQMNLNQYKRPPS